MNNVWRLCEAANLIVIVINHVKHSRRGGGGGTTLEVQRKTVYVKSLEVWNHFPDSFINAL